MAIDFELSLAQDITATDTALLIGAAGIAFTCWMKPESFNAAFTALMDLVGIASSAEVLLAEIDGSGIVDVYSKPTDTGSDGAVFAPTPVSIGQLVHVGYTQGYASDKVARLYINGVQVATNTPPDSNTPTSSFTYLICGSVEDLTFDGIVDDMRLYNRVLTANEMATIYAARGVDSIVYGMLNRWKLSEKNPTANATGANTIRDTAGNNVGTPNNTPVYADNLVRTRRRSSRRAG